MSCITLIGRHRYFGEDCDVPLPHSSPEWTQSKMWRLVEMACSEDPWKRAVAAGHPKLSSFMIPFLATDDHLLVRIAMVKNPVYGQMAFPLMKDDEDPGIRAYVKMVTENE